MSLEVEKQRRLMVRPCSIWTTWLWVTLSAPFGEGLSLSILCTSKAGRICLATASLRPKAIARQSSGGAQKCFSECHFLISP